jgi:hypothetical protein
MHALLDRHFRGRHARAVRARSAEKNWVLLLHDGTARSSAFRPCWFTRRATGSGGAVSVVCSGDTIVDPSAWNSAALPREWIGGREPPTRDLRNGPYYWLLITSGFRTYRLLSTFWRTFYPRYDVATLVDQQRLLKCHRDRAIRRPLRLLRRRSCGSSARRCSGRTSQGFLSNDCSDPHVTFFSEAESRPRWRRRTRVPVRAQRVQSYARRSAHGVWTRGSSMSALPDGRQRRLVASPTSRRTCSSLRRWIIRARRRNDCSATMSAATRTPDFGRPACV